MMTAFTLVQNSARDGNARHMRPKTQEAHR